VGIGRGFSSISRRGRNPPLILLIEPYQYSSKGLQEKNLKNKTTLPENLNLKSDRFKASHTYMMNSDILHNGNTWRFN
jgi:hypothetical protein